MLPSSAGPRAWRRRARSPAVRRWSMGSRGTASCCRRTPRRLRSSRCAARTRRARQHAPRAAARAARGSTLVLQTGAATRAVPRARTRTRSH
eukprot:3637230-Prymnesium_polylepis.1